MKVLIVVVGRVRGDLASAIEEYERRAKRYWKLEVVEVAQGAGRGDARPQVVKDAEAERILAKVPWELEVVAMTREGEEMSSRELARYLQRHGVRSSPGVAFVIGGAFGLGSDVLKRSRKSLSLSAMTLPHEMARLVVAEQLYRAGTILRGEPYHKG
ncbi:MAG: 23S rRNA (pseudouridine(1915)-N(3))-methyltransferase RlmH [Gemmatimonadetes bacterium]|nr:23S rRNA (pseudouridine(1915)-N(3))-methyltransferase RlmH [Gemmatimonadota bacterium]NNF12800.1 23S rRNA (pseudouridine(1915)-N(3))-methyltransferase RlmH [Gemmatimonadota bacterium]